jgi:hypothetical protein
MTTAPVQGTTGAVPIEVSFPSFDEVFFQLFTGELDDKWISLTGPSSGLPILGPSLFLSPEFWTILSGPAIS